MGTTTVDQAGLETGPGGKGSQGTSWSNKKLPVRELGGSRGIFGWELGIVARKARRQNEGERIVKITSTQMERMVPEDTAFAALSQVRAAQVRRFLATGSLPPLPPR